jgi:pyridoxine 5-phosphate synthase
VRRRLRLGVNIDHVATLRNARGGAHPDPLRAARAAQAAGADLITAHLREDRRHICDDDIEALLSGTGLPLNLEMAATGEMVEIALRRPPHAVCLVPERRRELTTEGGLDVRGGGDRLASAVAALNEAGIRVALFIDPEVQSLTAARDIGASVVELHTGAYCDAEGAARESELARLVAAAVAAEELGLECHAGHGLSFGTVGAVAAIAQIVELNIGHFLVGEAIFSGLESAIRDIRERMNQARRAIKQ